MSRIGLSFMLALAALLAWPASAFAQTFPPLSGRVVDAANIIPEDAEARLTQKLEALETQSQRQLVVATVPSLEGYEISDYGFRLGRAWGIGDKERKDGAVLIVAPTERKVRIEVGYGLEPVLTDGLSSLIVNQAIVPEFKKNNMAGGIEAGADAIIHQLTLPPAEAQRIAQSANAKPKAQAKRGGIPFSTLIWLGFIFLFFILPMIRGARKGGRRFGGSGLGNVILWSALNSASRGGGGGWGGGGGGFGGGGFSGGGGSFGGGGASGSW